MKDKIQFKNDTIKEINNLGNPTSIQLEPPCNFLKKILAPICLFEAWIDESHSLKNIKKVALANILFSAIGSLLLGLATYLIIALFMCSSLKIPLSPSIKIFYFSTFIKISLVYLVILLVVTAQNLFDSKFNMPKKVKKLILALFYDVKLENMLLRTLLASFVYIIAFSILFYVIGTAFTPYEGSIITKTSQINTTIFASIIISFIIIFLVQVYGINNPIKSSKRKIAIYLLSTIILITTTIGTLQNKTLGMDYSKVININFLSLIVAIIISVDRCLSNVSALIKEYEKINEYSKCETCNALKFSFKPRINNIKQCISTNLVNIKSLYNDFIKTPLKNRVLMCSFCIVFLIIYFIYKTPENIVRILNLFTILEEYLQA